MISTQILTEAARLMKNTILTDSVQIYNVGQPVTSGTKVTRALTAVGDPIPGLVQTTVLAGAVESQVDSTYSVKVAAGSSLAAGQVVKVVSCAAEPALVGKQLLIDKVSENGAAMLRKGVASDFAVVNQEGKNGL